MRVTWIARTGRLLLPRLALLVWAGSAWAQGAAPAAAPLAQAPSAPVTAERSVSDWLMRMHEASRRRAYVGTFVVSSDSQMATSRIWHVCDGERQVERVESLTGPPRSTFRRNEDVVTFSPQTRVAVAEKRESLALFPHLLKSADSAIDRFYSLRQEGEERVAGFDADVLLLRPRDRLRFGYRIWSERKTGLVMKLQTLDLDGRVLEQVAFSELQLDAPVSMKRLAQMMDNTAGYKVETPEMTKTSAEAEGWRLRSPVPGFSPASCWRRPVRTESAGAEPVVQWIFTDGLASVSLFLEAYDPRRHLHEGQLAMGATRTLSRRLGEPGQYWWLTAVGEVPQKTLDAFARGMERKR